MKEVTFVEPVRSLLEQVELRMFTQADGHRPELNAALEHLLASGGKRIRPILALLAGQMLGADQQRLVTLGACIELLHTATLVHDDLIDGALIRRGIPTLNAQWTSAATVLTGDFIFARSAMLAAESNSISVMKLFADTLTTIVNGEVTQLFTSRGLVSREDYYRRIYAKTASLFETATTTAALLTSSDEVTLEYARCFGYEIGMAFQIVDDILDFTGEQATVGKPLASDLRQGLVTLPALYYIEGHPNNPDMASILKRASCEESCITRLLTEIRQSGAIDQSMDEACQFVDRGLAALSHFPDCREREALKELAEYIVRRNL